MKIELNVSGGLAGLRLRGAIETADLDPELARRAEFCLQPAKLEDAASRGGASIPDAQQIDVGVTPDSGGATRSFELAEQNLDDETLDVLDALRYEITRREVGRRRAGAD